ncbi:hypothetical protein PZ897_09550 [Hoeflea sp. YIM 152468]|uniref:hypothetical protein n=1 Tax=Hoeflea sp. YIM 152468 TaxID=3031759 RepID=UPI0023D97FA9|nr:hypothetical protein [Hoeflea sp. YIM 152468]MDF1608420.1 hypothetical protein [Hoeflea sp. YIM 152468]
MSRLKTTILVMAALLPWSLAGCVAEPGPGPQSSARRSLIDANAILPPQSLLREDTNEALSHNRSESRLAYVGVWAVDADTCAMMDQTSFDGFAVLTPNTLRRSDETCSFEPGDRGSSSLQLEATCEANGRSTSRTLGVHMVNSQSLRLINAPGDPGSPYVRCHLQP